MMTRIPSSANLIASFHNVNKFYPGAYGQKVIFDNQTLDIPKKNIGVLGVNGAGKSTFVRLLSGAEQPTSGQIIKHCQMSWPLAFTGGFNGSLSGYENIRFICRIYDRDINEVAQFVEDFSELGDNLKMPIKTYSTGMRAKLNFGLSLAFDFDCYLIDETLSVGDKSFQAKSRKALSSKIKNSNIILVSHSMNKIKRFCDTAYLIKDGQIIQFNDLETAEKAYNEWLNEIQTQRQQNRN